MGAKQTESRKNRWVRLLMGSLLIVVGLVSVTGIINQALAVMGHHSQGLVWDFYLLFLGGAIYAAGLFYLILYASFVLTFAWLYHSHEHRS
ncbi:hypothetical protein [Desulfothermobacter acidiphilus]|uniref:hypothetical protein n=1 Tax=Desulfothermobacter acidiphilus TaxID=1938353 RepID=UPI003F89F3BB